MVGERVGDCFEVVLCHLGQSFADRLGGIPVADKISNAERRDARDQPLDPDIFGSLDLAPQPGGVANGEAFRFAAEIGSGRDYVVEAIVAVPQGDARAELVRDPDPWCINSRPRRP